MAERRATCECVEPRHCRTCPNDLAEGVAAADLQAELDRVEHRPAQYNGDPDGWTELRPYERVLSDDCEPGDLG